jgi:hypothetical protein
VDHVVDVMEADLTVAVAIDRLGDAIDELGEFGLVVVGDTLAGCPPFGSRGLVHDPAIVRPRRGCPR